MDKIYRNIYFHSTSMLVGKGNQIIKYYGSIFNNARFIKDFNKKYDPSLDLYVTCNSCLQNKINKFVKICK